MLAKTNKEPLRVGGVDILPFDAVRDLGFVPDSNLTMKKHVDGIVRSCFYRTTMVRPQIAEVRCYACTGTCIHSQSS